MQNQFKSQPDFYVEMNFYNDDTQMKKLCLSLRQQVSPLHEDWNKTSPQPDFTQQRLLIYTTSEKVFENELSTLTSLPPNAYLPQPEPNYFECKEYKKFREDNFDVIWNKRGGRTKSNSIEGRRAYKPTPEISVADGEANLNESDSRTLINARRHRKNAAVKLLRDRRRIREVENEIRVAFLQQENARLQQELIDKRNELAGLRKKFVSDQEKSFTIHYDHADAEE